MTIDLSTIPTQEAAVEPIRRVKQPKKEKKLVIAESDPKELEAIQAAIRAGRPTYWIRTVDGCTLDVLVDEPAAKTAWAAAADRTGLGYAQVKLFKRVGTAFLPYPIPKQVH